MQPARLLLRQAKMDYTRGYVGDTGRPPPGPAEYLRGSDPVCCISAVDGCRVVIAHTDRVSIFETTAGTL